MSRLGHVVRPHMRMLKNGRIVPVGFNRPPAPAPTLSETLRMAMAHRSVLRARRLDAAIAADPAKQAKQEILAKRARTARWGF